MYVETCRRGACQRERAVFIEDDELAVGVEETGVREGAILPEYFAGLHVYGREEGRAEMSCRSIDHVAEADGVLLVHARPLALPEFAHRARRAAPRAGRGG